LLALEREINQGLWISVVKCLIVNADDFGASRGINRAVIEAHQRGIVTSASLIVNIRWSREAAILSRAAPHLSVGLHVNLANESRALPAPDRADRAALHRQLNQFEDLVGLAPTHLDSHHNVHHDHLWREHFREFAREHGLILRGESPIRCWPHFYGRWGGESHPEHIGVPSLASMLAAEVGEGITEFSCHPGYLDPDFASSYAVEREVELRSLCDPVIRQVLSTLSIRLINHREAASLVRDLLDRFHMARTRR
jgi:chitin disaccharide deacetylase